MPLIFEGEYKNSAWKVLYPDIHYSKLIINNEILIFRKNKLTIFDNTEVIHIFDDLDNNYSGSWYDKNIENIDIDSSNKKLIYIINKYEHNNKIYDNVLMEIYFTDKGYNKIKNSLHLVLFFKHFNSLNRRKYKN
jgi:hypothetical protein